MRRNVGLRAEECEPCKGTVSVCPEISCERGSSCCSATFAHIYTLKNQTKNKPTCLSCKLKAQIQRDSDERLKAFALES